MTFIASFHRLVLAQALIKLGWARKADEIRRKADWKSLRSGSVL